MARKNLIEVSSDDGPASERLPPITTSRPLAGFVAPSVRSSPVGGITKTLGSITEKVERANDIEKRLAEGQTIVELDPNLIDGSFVRDRLGINSVELAELVAQIKDHGQQVPILVRPHPDTKGRYQVAYGHRRLAAIKELGIRVRAVIRELSDDQLVVSQGQENNSRANLSFIERSMFAIRLEERAFSRDIIMSALGVDKAALSKMISVVRQVPIELIEAIGAAPNVGRRRWMEFADKLESAKINLEELLASLPTENSSDERFQVALNALTKKQERVKSVTEAKNWASSDNSVTVRLNNNGKTATIALGAISGPLFASYITERLDDLYADWKSKQEN
ncbi:plasmid partitioning protein RepB [Mesorhizobium sp. SB112]|uniref:plasmid partitioning protein RepB n=1 Tax=Mesorhizobium sp. SB112 TaxID=3151853 RepID=UPI00326658C5